MGNTLDAVPDEGSWNNPAVSAVTFSTVKAEGFNSVRIPGNTQSSLTYAIVSTKDADKKYSNMGISFRNIIPKLDCELYVDGSS